MLAAATTTKYAFDMRPGDIYWCDTSLAYIYVYIEICVTCKVCLYKYIYVFNATIE